MPVGRDRRDRNPCPGLRAISSPGRGDRRVRRRHPSDRRGVRRRPVITRADRTGAVAARPRPADAWRPPRFDARRSSPASSPRARRSWCSSRRSGRRAASAGFLITLAADVAVMAPGTHIGAAHPVSPGGETPGGDVMAQKATADAAAYARTLAEARRRNATLAAEAVTESRAFTEHEALARRPAAHRLHRARRSTTCCASWMGGRHAASTAARSTIATAGGADRARRDDLAAIAARRHRAPADRLPAAHPRHARPRRRALEPGRGPARRRRRACACCWRSSRSRCCPSTSRASCSIVFGMALLGAELMVPSFGVLGIGGILALLVGSLMVTREVPGIRVGYGVIVPVVTAAVAIVSRSWAAGAAGAAACRPPTGTDGLIGARGPRPDRRSGRAARPDQRARRDLARGQRPPDPRRPTPARACARTG